MVELDTIAGESRAGDRLILPKTALAAVAASFLLMGALAAAYGPLLEYLVRRYAISLPVAGEAFSAHFAGAVVGVVAYMWAMERVSGRLSIWVALGSIAVGCAVVALAFSWPAFLVGAFMIGLGFGALDLGLNQLVAHSVGARRPALLNALNAAYGFGAVAGPILVSRLGQQHLTLLYTGAAVLAVALVPAAAGISGRLPVTPRKGSGRPGILVGMFLVGYVFYVGTETGIGGWMTTHLESVGLQSLDAASFTSAFWLALAVGRLLAALIPETVPPPAIVIGGSAIGSVALLVALSGRAAPFAYIVSGLAIAPVFPTGIAWIARLRPGDSRATAWIFPASMLGGVVIPAGIGLVIAWLGIGWAPAILSAVAVMMLAAFVLAGLRARE